MSLKKENAYKITLLVIAALMLVMGVIVLINPASIFPDPSWGLQVMRSMQRGGAFNLITGPSPDDISKNTSSFLSWWSPGQYLAPYFFQTIFGFNIGHSTAVTVISGNLCGIAGLYAFFKNAGFSKNVIAISLLFIVLQEAFWVPYAYYNGGEILLFAFEGWFLYGCISIKSPGIKLILFVLLSGWIGFFCKSSFMWIYVSGLLCLWIRLSSGQTNLWMWIKKGFWLGVPAVISLATIYFVYLSKGENPASMADGFKLTFEAISFPLASPVLAGLSVDDLLHGLLYDNGIERVVSINTILLLILLAASSLLLIILIIRHVPYKDYRLMVIGFYGMSVLFFSYSFLWRASISYEARHFRIIGLLITPGLIYLLQQAKLPYRVIFLFAWIFIAYNTFKYIKYIPIANKSGARGITGLSQPFIDQPSLDYILKLDDQQTNAIFVFISADIGLEIQHNRIITLNEDAADDDSMYKGHAGPIYLLLPADYTEKQATAMFKYFPGYSHFSPSRLSKNYILYTAQ